MPDPTPNLLRVDAHAIADPSGLAIRDASLLLEVDLDSDDPRPAVLALGPSPEVDRHPAAPHAPRHDATDSVVLPGLVNAHTHLDLSGIALLAPRDRFDGTRGFPAWADMVRSERPTDLDDIADAVERGIELSVAAGTVAVGDIAGLSAAGHTLIPLVELRKSPLFGVSYLEFFATGPNRTRAIPPLRAFLEENAHLLCPRRGVRAGLQPHAPYSVELDAYYDAIELARRHDLPLATHLAESPEEARFIAYADGPFRDFLASLGLLPPDYTPTGLGRGLSPVQHLAEPLTEDPFSAIHLNQLSDADIEFLAGTDTVPVYCPMASRHFKAPSAFGPHRYRDLLNAGLPVALGTDSLLNLPQSAADPAQHGLSILEQMRALHREGQTDPLTLLQMATVHGARALRLDAEGFQLSPASRPYGLIKVPIQTPKPDLPRPLLAALEAESPARPILIGRHLIGENTGAGS